MGGTRIRLDNERGEGYVRFSVKGADEATSKYSGVRVKKEDAWRLADEIIQSVGRLVSVRGMKDGKAKTNRVDIYVQ